MINRKKLLEVLTLVKPGLASKEIIEQTDCFIFKDGHVCTYNDELSVAHPIEFNVTGAVKAKELYDLLSKTKDDEIEITQVNDGIEIKAKKYISMIKTHFELALTTFIETCNGDGLDWKALPNDFSNALKICLNSVGKNMTEPALTCVYCHDEFMESCDRFRLTRYAHPPQGDAPTQGFIYEIPMLIPATAAKELTKFDLVEYAVDKGWIHFSSPAGTLFSCRTYEQLKFPDLTKLLDIEGSLLKFPSDMSEILGRATIFSSESLSNTQMIKIEIKDGVLKVSSQKESGRYEEWCRVRFHGTIEDISFHINPAFLSSIIDKSPEALVSTNRLKFTTDKFVHVVCSILGGK